MTERTVELGQWSRRERKRMGLSQQTIADALGISRLSFSRAEAGQRQFSWDEGWLLIETLGRLDTESVPEPAPMPPRRRR